MKLLLLLGLIFCLSNNSFPQSRSVERFRQAHRPSFKLFFYESTLKMLSRIDLKVLGDPDVGKFGETPPLGKMISGIEKVKFFMYEHDGASFAHVAETGFQQLEKEVREEGYENLISARVKNADMKIMVREHRESVEGFVVFVKMEKAYSIIDIEGAPNVEDILKLSDFINSKAAGMRLSEIFK